MVACKQKSTARAVVRSSLQMTLLTCEHHDEITMRYSKIHTYCTTSACRST